MSKLAAAEAQLLKSLSSISAGNLNLESIKALASRLGVDVPPDMLVAILEKIKTAGEAKSDAGVIAAGGASHSEPVSPKSAYGELDPNKKENTREA